MNTPRLLTNFRPVLGPFAGRVATMRVERGRITEMREGTVPGGIDLGGRHVLPGLNDPHVHLWKVGHLLTTMQDLRGVESLGDLQSRLRDFAGRLKPGQWYQGRGYNEAILAERRHPTRADLDAALGDRPGYLIRTCAHIAVANSAALRIAGITRDTAPPPGGVIEHDDAGEPTGVLHETALGLVANCIPPPTTADYAAMITAGSRHQLSLGITSATDPAVFPALEEAYRFLDIQKSLPQRVNLLAIRRPDGGTETHPLPQQHQSDFLRIDSVKFFADGGLSGATAALTRDYRHAATRGVLRFETEELYSLAREAHLAGLRIGTHAIGDAAIEQVLAIYERLAAERPGPRHRIEHLGLPTDDQLRRIATARIIAVPQAIFIDELGANFRRYLDDDYLARVYPLRRMIDAGIDVALSSDAPVVRNDNPFSGMRAAILRRDREGQPIAPAEALTVHECLHAYTVGGAIATGDEANRGSLEPGKFADFIIVDRDPTAIAPEELDRVTVEEVHIGGERVV